MSIEGPRSIRPDELPEVGRMLNRTFRNEIPEDMLEQFPVLLGPANAQNLLIIRDNERILSHAGMLLRDAVLEDVSLKLAMVGSVATVEEARGRGHATTLMNALMERAAQAGAHLAWISGGRGLYISRGAAAVGHLRRFTVKAGEGEPDMDLRELEEDDFPAMLALHEREPVRVLRTMDYLRATFRSRWVLNGPGYFWGVWSDTRLEAYLAVRGPDPAGKSPVVAEFSGDRELAASATPVIASRMNLPELIATVSPKDVEGCRAFEAVATSHEETHTNGTMLPLRMAECMQALRPRVAKRIGHEFADSLQFSESGCGPGLPESRTDRLRIARGSESVEVLGRAETAQFLFGGEDFSGLPAHEGSTDLLKTLSGALPLPSLQYGLDYC